MKGGVSLVFLSHQVLQNGQLYFSKIYHAGKEVWGGVTPFELYSHIPAFECLVWFIFLVSLNSC